MIGCDLGRIELEVPRDSDSAIQNSNVFAFPRYEHASGQREARPANR